MKSFFALPFLLVLCACHVKEDSGLVLIQIQDRNGLSETISNPDRLAKYHDVDFLGTQPYEKVLRVYRTEGKNSSVLTTYHPNGSTWQYLEAKEMRAMGAFREWFANGTLRIEATVIGGTADLTSGAQATWLFDGAAKVWGEQGNLLADMLYDKGALSGKSTYYYPSGTVKQEVFFNDDKVEGEAADFWEGGQLKSRMPYKSGLKDGLSLAFWPSGARYWEETYHNNLLISGQYWNTDDACVSEVKNGFGFRAIFENMALVQLQEIRDGLVEGLIKNFDAQGMLASTFILKDSKKQGEEIEYYPQKQAGEVLTPKLSLSWDQDLLHGPVRSWYDSGQLRSQLEMAHNKRSGISCAWYRDGSLMFTEEYEQDELIKGQYYQKNQKEPVSTISNGTGTATLYREDGSFLRKVVYANRKVVDPE